MRIEHPVRIEIDNQSIHPTLICNIKVEFDRNVEIPLSLSGRLFTGNKVIGQLNEYYHNTERNYNLRLLNENEKRQSARDKNSETHTFFLESILAPKALNYIENEREKNIDKSIEFYFELIGKSLFLPSDTSNFTSDDFIRLKIDNRLTKRVKIEQSQWCNQFSDKLGIGKFLLIELDIPDTVIENGWSETMMILKNNLNEMEQAIQKGDWEKSIFVSRLFTEKINIFKRKDKRLALKELLNEGLKKYGHNDEGIENLHNAIRSLFDFASKWSHGNTQDGTLKQVPTATKEDAYLVYSLSLSLFGILSRTLKNRAE